MESDPRFNIRSFDLLLTFQNSIQNPEPNIFASSSPRLQSLYHLIRVGGPLSLFLVQQIPSPIFPTPRDTWETRSNATPCVEASICHEHEVLLLNDRGPHAAYSIQHSPAEAQVKVTGSKTDGGQSQVGPIQATYCHGHEPLGKTLQSETDQIDTLPLLTVDW